jgi:UPF0755 protein
VSGSLRLFGWALLAVLSVLSVAGVTGLWLYREMTVPGPLTKAQVVVIRPNTGLEGIADLLAREGVLRYRLPFEIGTVLSGDVSALLAGEYEFPARTSPIQAIGIIASGKSVRHKLTIPEGLTTAEVLKLVRAAPALAGAVGPPPPEGSLMPDTYFYRYGEARAQILERMEREMTHTLVAVWDKRQLDLPLTNPEQLLTLASIVEKETARADERARIAAVFVNRLRSGMPLEADPTVIFALSDDGAKEFDRPLSHNDLLIPSPYNTYLERGLPPGPIDNPGLAALRAAARPGQTADLYFVADGSGGHVFAKTLAEHNHNVAQYRKSAVVEPDPPAAAPR